MTERCYNYTSRNRIKAATAMLVTSRGHDTRKDEFLMQPHFTPSTHAVKTCTKCGETKPATTEYYHLMRSAKDGFQFRCKECRRSAREDDKDRISEQRRAHYAKNRERILRRVQAYQEANKDRRKEYCRAYYEANRTRLLKKERNYRAANPERKARQDRAYRIANMDSVLAGSRRRRAMKRNAEGDHSASDVQRQYQAQRGRCYYCDVKVGDTYHVDHVIPLSRGGSNGPENIVIACPTCNTSKGTKMPHEWARGGRLL